jgi:hypothetical protein
MQDWLKNHPLLFVGLLLLGIACYWILIMNLISLTGGWKTLSKRFRLQQPYTGAFWKWQRAMMRMFVSYNGCLIVGADQMGLFLDIMLLFRPGHPALFVPWNEVTVARKSWMANDRVEMRLGRSEQVLFKIRGSLASQLQTAAGQSWPAPFI